MSYQALYRAWRPGTFAEMVGQEAVTQTLSRQVMTGRIAHAYLFCGTRGTGKTTAAKVLARAVNCLEPVEGDPCGHCAACRALAAENNMDVMEIDAASNNGVDEIRDLRERVQYPPTSVRYKVYIIDEVHMLSTGAFNALLKTLEEPPAHAVFILATTEPQRLPATILSRCQRFDFHRIPADTIIERLMVVLGGIGRAADEDALQEIARAAEGGMRDALSLLDVCLAYTDGEVTGELAREVLGTTGQLFMFDFVDALFEADAAQALHYIDEAMRRGSDPQIFVRDAAAHLRAVMLAAVTGDRLAGLLELTEEDAQRYREQAKRVSLPKTMRLTELFLRAEADMKWASRPRTILELCAVRACHPEDEPDAAIEERVERMEKALEKGVIAAPRPAAPASRQPAPSVAAGRPEAQNEPRRTGPQIEPPPEYLRAVEVLSQDNASMRGALPSMRFAGLENDVVLVEFAKKNIMHMRMLERKQALLEQAFSEAFGRTMHVSLRQESEGTGAPGAASAEARRRIEQSYEVFGREKIDITD